MNIRKANKSDIIEIMNIIKEAQENFKKQRINQWQNNYPNFNTINVDIENGYTYVIEKDNVIVATAAISFDGENTYKNIYAGNWLACENYAVIHRIAVLNKFTGKGTASEIIKFTEQLCKLNNIRSIKIDTHKDNIKMQNLLKRNNFQYCGIIYLDDNSERIAFEKLVDIM